MSKYAKQEQPEQQPQPAPRPELIKFVGPRMPDGRPLRFWSDIPARDLRARDIAALTDEQLKRALASDLYRPATDEELAAERQAQTAKAKARES